MKHDNTACPGPFSSARGAARALGWFSIGLGVVELLMPRATARTAGLRGGDALLRGYGLREIVNGVGLLAARKPGPWLWARVAGDALDIATLGARRDRRTPAQRNVLLALAALAGVTALDVASARAATAAPAQGARDYGGRSGLPASPKAMRGAALTDFVMPDDMRTPALLRPYVVS